MAGPLHGCPHHRAGRHRSRALRRHDAGRHGSRGHPGRAGPGRARRPARARRRGTSCSGVGAPSALDLKNPDGVETLLTLVEKADALIEGFRPGVMERLGRRARRLPGPEPAAGVRPHDRLGPGRAVRPGRRPRHQLHRAGRRPRPLRSPWRAADAAAQHGRRLRRRRHAPGLRCRVRPPRGPAQRPGAGGRRGHGRRFGRADDHVLGHAAASGCSTRPARGRTCWTPAPTSTTSTAAQDGDYISIGSIEPQFYAELLRLTGLDGRSRVRAADGPGALAGAQGPPRAGLPDEDP